MSRTEKDETLCEGRFLRLVKRGTWEFVSRKNASGVVAIVPITGDGKVVLVEQERPAVSGRVLEMPAGLAGDVDDAESLIDAARRELEEETGYRAASWTLLASGLSSAGLTDEAVTIFLATGLEKVGAGGGVGSESITVHEVPVPEVLPWLLAKSKAGIQFDLKLLAAVYAAVKKMEEDLEQ